MEEAFLKTIRKDYGLYQEALADKACLDRTYVIGIETGKRNISLKALNSIAKTLEKIYSIYLRACND